MCKGGIVVLGLFNKLTTYIAFHPVYGVSLIIIYTLIVFNVAMRNFFGESEHEAGFKYERIIKVSGNLFAFFGAIVIITLSISAGVLKTNGVDSKEYTVKSFSIKEKDDLGFRNKYSAKVEGGLEFYIRANKLSEGDKIECTTVIKGYNCALKEEYLNKDNERVEKLIKERDKEEGRRKRLEEVKLKVEAEKELKRENELWYKKLRDLAESRDSKGVYRNKIIGMELDKERSSRFKSVYSVTVKNNHKFYIEEIDSENPIMLGDEVSCRLVYGEQFACWMTKYKDKNYTGKGL